MYLYSYTGQNFVPKLKDHILPRIKYLLREEAASNPNMNQQQGGQFSVGEYDSNLRGRDAVFFQKDRMYRHHLARFNYTTYDVRRAQDVINPATSHRDVMLLADTAGDSSDHPFLYCRVLGIFHVNVVYTGEGMIDYNARRVDFLWVRWFRYDGDRSVRWDDHKLDSLCFLPMAREDAFGFVDPRNVLRGSHIISAFASGKTHQDEVSLSRHAYDANDWSRYYVNRCVIVL